MSTPAPHGPCPFCTSTSFLRVKDMKLSVASETTNAMAPRFTMLVCAGCGRTDWFTDPNTVAPLFGARAERVDIAGSPYR